MSLGVCRGYVAKTTAQLEQIDNTGRVAHNCLEREIMKFTIIINLLVNLLWGSGPCSIQLTHYGVYITQDW